MINAPWAPRIVVKSQNLVLKWGTKKMKQRPTNYPISFQINFPELSHKTSLTNQLANVSVIPFWIFFVSWLVIFKREVKNEWYDCSSSWCEVLLLYNWYISTSVVRTRACDLRSVGDHRTVLLGVVNTFLTLVSEIDVKWYPAEIPTACAWLTRVNCLLTLNRTSTLHASPRRMSCRVNKSWDRALRN